MSVELIRRLNDDLDGGAATQTVAFSWGGKALEIDLSDANYKVLADFMGRYAGKAREAETEETAKKATKKRKTSPGLGRDKSALIREWAKTEWPEPLSDRGRVPAKVIAAYDAAGGKTKARTGGQGQPGSQAGAGSGPAGGISAGTAGQPPAA